MADAFVGEIRMFSGNFAPRGWLLCNGQFLNLSEYNVLFSVIGFTYGRRGTIQFQLPNLCARAPLHAGQSPGPGLSVRNLGSLGGHVEKYITSEHMPTHRHTVVAKNGRATDAVPSEKSLPAAAYLEVGPPPVRNKAMYKDYTGDGHIRPISLAAVQATGSKEPEVTCENYQPFLTSTFIICYDGIFPASD